MRKFLIWGSMLLLILITAYSIWQREDGGLSYQTVTEHKAEKIASRMQEQETLEGFSLCFAGEKLPYDDGSKTFFCRFPHRILYGRAGRSVQRMVRLSCFWKISAKKTSRR